MKLYTGSSEQFIQDVLENKLADKLKTAYEGYYYRFASPQELVSWTNSLQFVKNIIEYSSLKDNMLVVEYELPYSNRRIDCLLFGKGPDASPNAVIMELKQWSKVENCDLENEVLTFTGGAKRFEAHPSFQAQGYYSYLKDFVEVFGNCTINLSAISYCHNYSRTSDVMFGPKFQSIMKDFPLFAKEDVQELARYLKARLSGGGGLEIFNRFSSSPVGPTKKLLEHTSKMIKGQKVFNLLEDQLAAYYAILDRAKKATKLKDKCVIIVRGGPGTGKSVIALNVIAELLSKGQTVFHATGSAAFTSTLRKIVGNRAASMFKYFISFTDVKENSIDVLVCDEAHRIRAKSVNRFTPKAERTDKPQIDELVEAAKVSVFFIDDYQVVRPSEQGSTEMIRASAKKHAAEVFEFELKTQFRCNGSDGYLNWLDNALGIRETANKMLTKNEKMSFEIFDSPHALYEAIKRRNEEKPNSARMAAGFCWPWSNPKSDGTLVEDVVIGDFRMTWEAKNDMKVAPGIPPAKLWAYDPQGVSQMGSIYTIQGFEFDYVGVVFGDDLSWDAKNRTWVGKPQNSSDAAVKRDKENFVRYVKNAYRVLLTRGMMGCYVYFINKDTESYFRSLIQTS
ncbi:MAG: DUF2075 domain-containing protein [Nitrososphaerota archaeon]|nr:DUF2075 domain-containing protein [Nitrososphaerota archaeon]MDG6919010.1 DUF2075 domain-containing protein [Nitrososphaerota archaeon]